MSQTCFLVNLTNDHTPLNILNPLECIRMILGPRHFPPPWSTANRPRSYRARSIPRWSEVKTCDGKSYRLLRTDSTLFQLFQSSNESNATSRELPNVARQCKATCTFLQNQRSQTISDLKSYNLDAICQEQKRTTSACGQLRTASATTQEQCPFSQVELECMQACHVPVRGNTCISSFKSCPLNIWEESHKTNLCLTERFRLVSVIGWFHWSALTSAQGWSCSQIDRRPWCGSAVGSYTWLARIKCCILYLLFAQDVQRCTEYDPSQETISKHGKHVALCPSSSCPL